LGVQSLQEKVACVQLACLIPIMGRGWTGPTCQEIGGPRILASGLALRWHAGPAPVTKCNFPRKSRPEAHSHGFQISGNCTCNAVPSNLLGWHPWDHV
jgi:hypothetical protein